jgi:hypothetical protein
VGSSSERDWRPERNGGGLANGARRPLAESACPKAAPADGRPRSPLGYAVEEYLEKGVLPDLLEAGSALRNLWRAPLPQSRSPHTEARHRPGVVPVAAGLRTHLPRPRRLRVSAWCVVPFTADGGQSGSAIWRPLQAVQGEGRAVSRPGVRLAFGPAPCPAYRSPGEGRGAHRSQPARFGFCTRPCVGDSPTRFARVLSPLLFDQRPDVSRLGDACVGNPDVLDAGLRSDDADQPVVLYDRSAARPRGRR